MTPHPFSLDRDGYFRKSGRTIIPVGVNYWPASCGVEMWRVWPEKEIARDLDLVGHLGFNCVRFFLRWEDFEPRPGAYHRAAFARLTRFLQLCRERKILTQPCLMVGWMSGGIFWPKWKCEKNLFTDRALSRRATAFATKVARICARYADTVLVIDHGNEICCLPDCLSAPPSAVESWCDAMSRAIRRGHPGALVISGNEQNQIVSDTGWRFGRQPGTDLYSMHAYPNSSWHSLAFDGMTDPLAQSLLPFYVKCARAFGPVMVQEFSTLLTAGRSSHDYLRAILPACWAAGANGFLWWSLRDIQADGHPYNKNAFEGPLGLVAADEQAKKVKETLAFFHEFAASLASKPMPAIDEGDIALYWPREFYSRDNPLNPGNEPRALSRRLVVAHFILSQLGHRVGVVRGDRALDFISASTIVVPGEALTIDEVRALSAWVKAGGTLIWQGIEVTTWGADLSALIGGNPADMRAPRALNVRAFGRRWDFRDFPRGIFTEAIPSSAEVRARDDKGRPLVLRHSFGKGKVIACLAQPDDTFAAQSDDRSVRPLWLHWYAGILAEAGISSRRSRR